MLYEAKMPSLKDKLAEQAESARVEIEEVTEDKVEKKKVKGRRLNK